MRRLYAVNFLPNIATSASVMIIPLVASQLGLSLFELGMVGAAYSLGAFLSYYFFGRWSDERGNRSGFIKAGLLALAIASYLQIFMTDFLSMVLVRFSVGLALGVFTFPMVATVAEPKHMKKNIAFLTSSASIGWFFGQLFAGILGEFQLIFTLGAMVCVFAWLLSLFIPKTRTQKVKVSLFPKELIRRNSRLYFAFFLRNLGAWNIWIVFPLFLRGLGASLLWIGIISAANPLVQAVFMPLVGRLAYRVNSSTLIKIGFALSAITFISYSFASHYLHALPVQVLLGIAWAFLWVGSLVSLASKNIEKATATGLLGSTQQLAMFFAPLIGGTIAFFWGFTATMYFAFACALAAVFIARKL